jgi:ATP-dependent Clp protease adaptor protein ClpS
MAPSADKPILPEETPDVAVQDLTSFIPLYHVILLDDDDHSYEYVIEMLMGIFGHSEAKAYEMACVVDREKRVIVETTYKERAEMKRSQIHSYGADWRIPQCKGSMSATIEPADTPGGSV